MSEFLCPRCPPPHGPTPQQVALTPSQNSSFCGTPPPPGSPVPWCQRSQYPLQPFPPAPTKASTHSSSRKRRRRKTPGQSSVRLFMLRSLRERSGPMSRPAVGHVLQAPCGAPRGSFLLHPSPQWDGP